MNHLSMSVTFNQRNVFKIIYVDAQLSFGLSHKCGLFTYSKIVCLQQ